MTLQRDPIDTFTDDDLIRARDNAWVEAARCWQEYRSAPAEIAAMMRDGARSAEHHWRTLYVEARARGLR